MNKRYPKAMCLIILSGMLICFCYPQILKMRCYTVVSGSMSPALPVGAAVYVKEKQPREIKKGEIITFFEGETVITHRVMEIDENAQLFMTKGDANEKQDTQPVKWENGIWNCCFYSSLCGVCTAVSWHLEWKSGGFVLFPGVFSVHEYLGRRESKKEREIK